MAELRGTRLRELTALAAFGLAWIVTSELDGARASRTRMTAENLR
jgi:hypothetical protein